MHTLSSALVAIVLYLLGAFRIAAASNSPPAARSYRTQAGVLFVLAALFHAAVLHSSVFLNTGIDLGIFNTASLVGWCIGALTLVSMFAGRNDSLSVVIYPTIAGVVGLALAFPTSRVLPPNTAFGLQLHIALSIFAYALFAIATVQALYLGVADYKLRHHRPSMDFLPPLPTMETTLFQLTGLAFTLLTLSLVIGALYIENVSDQHLAHKIVFSLLAWAVFATLLIGRRRFGWRGRRAIKFVIIGFALLAVGFFGTKFVLELILHRV